MERSALASGCITLASSSEIMSGLDGRHVSEDRGEDNRVKGCVSIGEAERRGVDRAGWIVVDAFQVKVVEAKTWVTRP